MCAQAFGVGVQGHDLGNYNGIFRRVGVHAGQPRFERSLPNGDTVHLYYHGPSAAWFLKSSFTPEQASRKSWIASASGALPTGLHTWQNGLSSAATSNGVWVAGERAGAELAAAGAQPLPLPLETTQCE